MDLAVILAGAGEGRRMGALGPKLLIEISGRPALARVVETFLDVTAVGEIVAVVPAALLPDAQRALATVANPRGVTLVATPGGAERQESVWLGLQTLTSDLPYVAVHDVARVLVRPALIERVLAAARATGAAIPTLPIRDSVKEVVDGRIAHSFPRERLSAAQTPQIFTRDILTRAHARAREREEIATDDAALVESLGVAIAAVPGDPSNLKLTFPGDLVVFEALIQFLSKTEA